MVAVEDDDSVNPPWTDAGAPPHDAVLLKQRSTHPLPVTTRHWCLKFAHRCRALPSMPGAHVSGLGVCDVLAAAARRLADALRAPSCQLRACIASGPFFITARAMSNISSFVPLPRSPFTPSSTTRILLRVYPLSACMRSSEGIVGP